MRTYSVRFRLAPPRAAPPLEVRLSQDEHELLAQAACGKPLGTLVRELVESAVLTPQVDAIDALRTRVEALGLPTNLYCRLVVLMAIGAFSLEKDVARARAALGT